MRIIRSSKRGLLLLSVLFFTVLIAMFVSAAVAFAPSGFARSETDRATQAADAAARSGIEWVRNRISADPRWCASITRDFNTDDLRVHEQQGLVTGWLRQGSEWSRFRVRFNYQDGAARVDSRSDGMSNPNAANTCVDFPYVSCNNLGGDRDRAVPVAMDGSRTTSSFNWSNTQLTIPRNTMLVSCEGGSGKNVTLGSNGFPTTFSGGFRRKIVQTVFRFGSAGQVADAAVMSAGDLNIISADGNKALLKSSPSTETARVRSKGKLEAYPGVYSARGDLRFHNLASNAGVLAGSVSTGDEPLLAPFYQIPESKLKIPETPVTLPAGVYEVDILGRVSFYARNYEQWASGDKGTSVPFTLPSGMQMVKKADGGSGPLWSLQVTADVQVQEHDGISDLALVPDGGAPQSRDYGGVRKTSSVTLTSADTDVVTSLLPEADGVARSVGTGVADAYRSAMVASGARPEVSSGGDELSFPVQDDQGNDTGGRIKITGDTISLVGNSESKSRLAAMMTSKVADDAVTLVQAVKGNTDELEAVKLGADANQLTSSQKLHPDDLQLNLQGDGVDGLILKGPGNLIFGSQVLGQGGALVSQKDVRLIGTSTDLSSAPDVGLGLNCYAKHDFIVDSYQVNGPGQIGFGKVNLTGVVYAWNNITISAGTGTNAQPFTFRGAMIAYGGNPAGAPMQWSAQTNIQATTISVTYDPSYVSALTSSGPYFLQTLSWHEF